MRRHPAVPLTTCASSRPLCSNSLHIFIAIVSHKGLAAYALGSSIVDSEARWAPGNLLFWQLAFCLGYVSSCVCSAVHFRFSLCVLAHEKVGGALMPSWIRRPGGRQLFLCMCVLLRGCPGCMCTPARCSCLCIKARIAWVLRQPHLLSPLAARLFGAWCCPSPQPRLQASLPATIPCLLSPPCSMRRFWSVVLPFTFASPVGIFIGYIASDVAKGVGAACISALASGGCCTGWYRCTAGGKGAGAACSLVLVSSGRGNAGRLRAWAHGTKSCGP